MARCRAVYQNPRNKNAVAGDVEEEKEVRLHGVQVHHDPQPEAIVVVYGVVSPGVRAMVDTVSKRQRRRIPTAGPETDAVDTASRKCLRPSPHPSA